MKHIKGESLLLSPFDVIARAQRLDTEGELLVLNNNSTHYLVVKNVIDQPGRAIFIKSFKFEESEESIYMAYIYALMTMTMEMHSLCDISTSHPDNYDQGERINGGDPACPRT